MNKTTNLFADREELFLRTLRQQLPKRHNGSALRWHIYQCIWALRSIRGAQAAYNEGLKSCHTA